MNAFMNEVFAIFGMFFSFGLLVAGLLKLVRYFSELNEFKSDSIRLMKWLKNDYEKVCEKIFEIENSIDVLKKRNNTNRDSQRVLETDVARLFERQKEELEAIRKLSESVGLFKIELESLRKYTIKAENKIVELQERIDKLSAKAE